MSSDRDDQRQDEGRDVHGNLRNRDIQDNPDDRNVHGNRPQDSQGNPERDIYGNEQ